MDEDGINAAKSDHNAEGNAHETKTQEPENMDDFEVKVLGETEIIVTTSIGTVPGDDNTSANAEVEETRQPSPENGFEIEDMPGEDMAEIDEAIITQIGTDVEAIEIYDVAHSPEVETKQMGEQDEESENKGCQVKFLEENKLEEEAKEGEIHEGGEQEREGSMGDESVAKCDDEESETDERKHAGEKEDVVVIAKVKYERGDRYDEHIRRISGDFVQKGVSEVFVPAASYVSFSSFASEEIEAESSTLTESEESVRAVRDRTPYIELFDILRVDYPMIKLKNNFLQRKMADYFKRRKMDHHLREFEHTEEVSRKYFSKLDALWDLRKLNNTQREVITRALGEKRVIRDRQEKSATNSFDAMVERERAIGTGLIYTKTGNPIPEKCLERLLKNQRAKHKEMHNMRLRLIKVANNIGELSQAIETTDRIGSHFSLMDYEQLRCANQMLADKIEERDGELLRLRLKSESATQTLAHHREKAAFISMLIEQTTEELDIILYDKNCYREQVGTLKHERDCIRTKIQKLRQNSGMLLHCKLLQDMYDTVNQVDSHKEEIANTKLVHKQNAKSIRAIKQNLEAEQNHARSRRKKFLKPKQKKGIDVHENLSDPGLQKFKIFNTALGKYLFFVLFFYF